MFRSNLSLSRLLASLSWPRSYEGKLLAVALGGTCVPLLALLGYLLLSSHPWAAAWPGVLAVVVATLIGTWLVRTAVHALLAPVRRTAAALDAYRRSGTVPALPTHFPDEAGQLMRSAQQTISDLDALLQVRNRLLGVLSHDLRTPLSTIQLAADLLTEELGHEPPDAAFLAELASAIHTSVQDASQLTLAFLDSARSDSSLALRPEHVSTTELLTRLAANVRFLAQRKQLDVAVEDHAEALLYVDRSKLLQVLGNFATNAIKFTPPGGQLRLVARATGDEVVFEVHDTGVGFDAAHAAALFEAFDEGHTNGTEGEAGHGLGLWISKTFAERLGGAVSAESTPGRGSVFRVTLPREAVGLVYRLPQAA